jgi:hypothetical protein
MVFLFVLFVCSVAGQIVNVTDATFPLSATLYPPNVQTRPSLSGLCDLAGGGNDLQLAATVDSLSLTYRFSLTGVTFVTIVQDNFRDSLTATNQILLYAESAGGAVTCLDYIANDRNVNGDPFQDGFLPLVWQIDVQNTRFARSSQPAALSTAANLIVKFVHRPIFSSVSFTATGSAPLPRVFSDCRVDPSATTSCNFTTKVQPCQTPTCDASTGRCTNPINVGAVCAPLSPFLENTTCAADGNCVGPNILGSRPRPFEPQSLPVTNASFTKFPFHGPYGSASVWCDNWSQVAHSKTLFIKVNLTLVTSQVSCIDASFTSVAGFLASRYRLIPFAYPASVANPSFSDFGVGASAAACLVTGGVGSVESVVNTTTARNTLAYRACLKPNTQVLYFVLKGMDSALNVSLSAGTPVTLFPTDPTTSATPSTITPSATTTPSTSTTSATTTPSTTSATTTATPSTSATTTPSTTSTITPSTTSPTTLTSTNGETSVVSTTAGTETLATSETSATTATTVVVDVSETTSASTSLALSSIGSILLLTQI